MNKIKTIVSISITNFFLIISLVSVVSFAKDPNTLNDPNINSELYSVDNTVINITQSVAQTITPIILNTVVPTNKPVSTPKPAAPTKAPSNRCIIQIQGVKYDITEFKKIHSGGDIFKCGTDMTSIFFGQHNSSTLSTMAKYKI